MHISGKDCNIYSCTLADKWEKMPASHRWGSVCTDFLASKSDQQGIGPQWFLQFIFIRYCDSEITQKPDFSLSFHYRVGTWWYICMLVETIFCPCSFFNFYFITEPFLIFALIGITIDWLLCTHIPNHVGIFLYFLDWAINWKKRKVPVKKGMKNAPSVCFPLAHVLLY